MTEEMKMILLIGGVAVSITLVIFLLMRWIRKTFYEYNEYTGRVELKSKIEEDNKNLQKAHEEYMKQKSATPEFIPNSVDKRSVKYVPKDEYFEEWLFVRAVAKRAVDGKYLMKFQNYFDESENITLFVDDVTYNESKIGDSGNLCYNYKYNIFHYFDMGPKIFKDEK